LASATGSPVQKYSFYVLTPPWKFVAIDLASTPPSGHAEADNEGGAMGGDLAIVDPAQVSSLPAFDMVTGKPVVSFARLPDGRILTVVYPEFADASGVGWHVFFGFPEHLVERSIMAASGANGYASQVTFDVDGEKARADMSVVTYESGTGPGPVRLVLDQQTFEGLNLQFWQSKPDEHSYLCRHP
jgi:hypothetical protein